MPSILRYVVTSTPDEGGEGYEYDDYDEAKSAAAEQGACVIEHTYEWSESEMVDDFRPGKEDDEESETHLCDGCGEAVDYPENHYTDEEVCGNADGPGFMLCGREGCPSSDSSLSVEQRREVYTAGRAKNMSEE